MSGGDWRQGRESVVYGCIRDMDFGDAGRRHQTNCEAILALPDREGWPLISRDMFSLPIMEQGIATRLVHFGGCYRGVEYEWAHWLQQFENLLGQMYWVSATVRLETELYGIHTFEWEASEDFHAPGDGNFQFRCQWGREGLLQEF